MLYYLSMTVSMPTPPDVQGNVTIDPRLPTTFTQQLREQFAWLIASGQLGPGNRLPSVRRLAQQLTINVNTVHSAYQGLKADGLVETRRGVGTCVLRQEPARLARAGGSIPSHTVGVIIPSLENPFYHAFLQGIEACTHQDRRMLFVCSVHEDPTEARRYLAQLAAKGVDGVIVAGLDPMRPIGSDVEPHAASTLPLVTVDQPDCVGFSVLIDLEMAGYLATRHLLDHGHRRVGLVTYPTQASNVRPVIAGFERALGEAAIQPDRALVAEVPGFGTAEGAEGTRRLLALPEPPTAIFAIADMLAIGAMAAIKQADLRIPEDVGLTSFNDIPLAGLVDPPLTTVAAPARQAGVEAMHMLECLIGGKRPPRKRVTLPVSLIVRQSCGAHESPG
jgi:DNA-binding LacI/PurR family transcriptional regulator